MNKTCIKYTMKIRRLEIQASDPSLTEAIDNFSTTVLK